MRNIKKGKLVLACALSIMIIGITGCGTNEEVSSAGNEIAFELDENGEYKGFDKIDTNITEEKAIKDGYFVRSENKTAGGEQKWEEFIKDAKDGQDANVRLVQIFDDHAYYKDLFFQDGQYYMFASDEEEQEDVSYKYLLQLEGTFPNSDELASYTVLTNDEELTFDDIVTSMISSDLNEINDISEYKIVF